MWSGIRSFLWWHRSRGSVLPAVLLGLGLASGCSGRSTVNAADDDDTAGASARAGRGGTSGVSGRGGSSAGGGTAGRGGTAGTGGSGDVPYDDPGCPDAPAPEAIVECGVFDAVNACAPGLVCKPNIEHPYGSGCDTQVFNMRCVAPGPGAQGDPCENGMSDCGEGFICVVGASHGAHCLRMCPLDGATRCPAGYVCGATDAAGIGVCA